jgi:hypothetical protein
VKVGDTISGTVANWNNIYPYVASYIVSREDLSINTIPELLYPRMPFKIKEIVNDDIFLRIFLYSIIVAVDMENLYEHV